MEEDGALGHSNIQRYRKRGGTSKEDGKGVVDIIGKKPRECGGLKAKRRSIFRRGND